MEDLIIEGTDKLPTVNMIAAEGLVELRGRSVPEDSMGFYKPILDWLREYSEGPAPKTKLVVALEYFNTSSSKFILDMFKRIEDIHTARKSEAVIEWHHEEEDWDMQETGEDYRSIVEVPFEIIEVDEF